MERTRSTELQDFLSHLAQNVHRGYKVYWVVHEGAIRMADKRVRQTRIYEKVVDGIKERIASGALRQGEPVPPERQLMEDIGVSRSSLREAFRVLELLGLIESIPGKGRFVRRGRGEDGGIPDPRKLEDAAILELMEARRVLDPAIAAEAARKARSGDLTRLRRVLSATEAHMSIAKDRAQADFDFHLVLTEATQNFVFVNIVKMTFNLIMATHDRIYSLLSDKDAFLHEHREIYDAILNHDGDGAMRASSRHIERIYRTLQEALALEGP